MNAFVGTGPLIRLILRRDRVWMPVWVLLPALLAASIASAWHSLYPTSAGLELFARQIAASPGEVALLGPVFAPTLGGLTAWRWSIIGAILVGVASMLTVIRHTRTDEEAGRLELLGSTVVGRHAPLTAALAVTCGANVVVAVSVALALIGYGLPTAGSVALGLSAGAAGVLFAVVAGLAAQLTQSAGAAKGIAVIVLGVSYVIRSIGDAGGVTWLSWISPVGWMHLIRPFADERWWVFVLFGATVVALGSAAYALSARRDLGAGVLPDRLGPATGSPGLSGPFGLAWRLHRAMLLSWIAGFVAFGVIFGYVGQTAADQLSASPQLMQLLARMGTGTSISDMISAVFVALAGQIAAVYAIQATLRMRSEETSQRAEPVLATSVGRLHWAASHLSFAVIGPGLLMAAMGIASGLSTGDPGRDLPRVLGNSIAQLPAIWVMAGVALALFGLLPRLSSAAWAVLVAFALIGQVGTLLRLSQWMIDISPFSHVPNMVIGGASLAPLLWLAIIATGLTLLGLAGFRQRDVA